MHFQYLNYKKVIYFTHCIIMFITITFLQFIRQTRLLKIGVKKRLLSIWHSLQDFQSVTFQGLVPDSLEAPVLETPNYGYYHDTQDHQEGLENVSVHHSNGTSLLTKGEN